MFNEANVQAIRLKKTETATVDALLEYFENLSSLIEHVIDDDVSWAKEELKEIWNVLYEEAHMRDEEANSDEALKEIAADRKFHMMRGD